MKKFIFGMIAGWAATETGYLIVLLTKHPDSRQARKIKKIYGAIPLAFKDPANLTDDQKLQLMEVTNKLY